uniref:PAK4-inhibitor INKA2 isoform X1 n=1 Tax=Sus scrofa TaxID=9823 RepID=A0A480IAJ0_PIG
MSGFPGLQPSPSPAVTSSPKMSNTHTQTHTLFLSLSDQEHSPPPPARPLPRPLPTSGSPAPEPPASPPSQGEGTWSWAFESHTTSPASFPGPGPLGFSPLSDSRIQTQTAVLISKPEGEDSRALGQPAGGISPRLGSVAPGKGQCPEPLEWLRFFTFCERPARGSGAVGVTQPGFSFSSRSRSGRTLRKNFLKMLAVRANLRPSSRGCALPALGAPASPLSPRSPPFSSSGRSSQLPTRSAKTLSPNTRGCRFRPRDISVEVQSSSSPSSGACGAQLWCSGSRVLGRGARSLPPTLLCDGNLVLLPSAGGLEGEQARGLAGPLPPSHRGGSGCVPGLPGQPGAGPPPEISSCSRAVCTCRSFSSCSAPIMQFI